jgi:SagB-type dehydrogenase family enzyme
LKKIEIYISLTVVILFCLTAGFGLSHAEGIVDTMKTETIKLPAPAQESDTSIEEAMAGRRSVRRYKDTPLKLEEVSQLLWAAQGVTSLGGLRTAPSAGALYPLEVYVVAGNVEGLPAGIYNYIPLKHELKKVASGDRRAELSKAALGQAPVKNAAAVIVFSAVYSRITGKYGKRGIQYTYIETGHAAQNVLLQAVSLELGAVVIGAFYDDSLKEVMNLPDEEDPLYIMPVGRIK